MRPKGPHADETAQERSLPHSKAALATDLGLQEVASDNHKKGRSRSIIEVVAGEERSEGLQEVFSATEGEIAQELLFSILRSERQCEV